MLHGDRVLTEAIASAARQAFSDLFARKESYYYCALVTTGAGTAPIVAACSQEGLAEVAARMGCRDSHDPKLRWKIQESPYYNYGQEHFATVNRLFAERPSRFKLTNEAWSLELGIRLQCMEEALARLDSEKVFEQTQPRHSVLVQVDVMPDF